MFLGIGTIMCYTYTRFPLCCNVIPCVPHTIRSLKVLFVAIVPLNLRASHLVDLEKILLIGIDAERTGRNI
jgi:hypothetical protein